MNKQQINTWLDKSFDKDSQHKPLLMGVVNITPDSFNPDSRFIDSSAALAKAIEMIDQGADIIDIGGESSRPFAEPLPVQDELDRVIPVIKKIRANFDICISIDTYKEEVMLAAVAAGADIINAVDGLDRVTNLHNIQKLEVPIILNHMQGSPETMQENPRYSSGVINTINNFFAQKIATCGEFGIPKKRLILDPGFGFGKTVNDNLDILRNISTFKEHGLPILIGLANKSTIGKVLDKPVGERMIGSIAANCYSIMQGANIIRAHDVAETRQAITMLEAINSRSEINEQ